jgi:hypothetical protein
LTIQFREFERPKKGGQMQLKESKTITLHDVSLKVALGGLKPG